jgi:hypothetical protein
MIDMNDDELRENEISWRGKEKCYLQSVHGLITQDTDYFSFKNQAPHDTHP